MTTLSAKAVLEGLVAIIGSQADMTVIAKANDGREALELWRTHCPDVTLLDLRMKSLKAGCR
jgi:two-component system NarL family response regulator